MENMVFFRCFPLLRRFLFKVRDFHHFSSLTSSLISTSVLSAVSSPLLSLSVFCCGRFFLCFVLSLVLRLLLRCCRSAVAVAGCCVAAAGAALLLVSGQFFSLSPLVFSVTQAIAEQLSGALFCSARRVHVSWPSRRRRR